MRFDFFSTAGSKSFRLIDRHEFVHDILCFLGDFPHLLFLRPINPSLEDILKNFLGAITMKGWIAKEEFKQDTSNCPPIDHAILSCTINGLRGEVIWRPNEFPRDIIRIK
jgi:hypothetical protein